MLETRGGASNVWEWRTRAEKKTPAIRYFLCFFLKESPQIFRKLQWAESSAWLFAANNSTRGDTEVAVNQYSYGHYNQHKYVSKPVGAEPESESDASPEELGSFVERFAHLRSFR
jgi:hypothetical protein